jgi:hypothetical protein
MLRVGSGLGLEVIRERGYRTVVSKGELSKIGFAPAQQRVPGLLMPVHGPDGSNSLYSYRPDSPRQTENGKLLKYEFPKNARMRLDVPPRSRAALADPTVPIWITEGQKKADALATHRFIAVALLGVWNFKGRNKFGGVTLLADFDYIVLKGRTVNIVFDSDVMTKQPVQDALARLTEHLQRKSATVNAVYLPSGPNGEKVGADDFLLNHSVDELKKLICAPRPPLKPAVPKLELLTEPPPALNRPLDLINGVAYAATWLYVQRTVTEMGGKDGEIVSLNPPRIERLRELYVVRGDGQLFGPGGHAKLEELGFDIQLGEPAREGKMWRADGVMRYTSRRRPKLAKLFGKISGVYDHFLDFNRSVADQRTMCEFSACATLVTWFSVAFTVIGYFWPTGERGSGKTKWGTIWAMTSYLGEVLLSSGSFAAIRDLASYGGAMLFDDAEGFADPRRCDPNKRELLLAGNRRGTQVPLKEPGPNRTWITKWVNAYCPRAFTAISTPDPVLSSRTIAIPLIRTANPVKANADPADPARWPCDYRLLQDYLWAAALARLPEAACIWTEFESETSVIGREFEPWRAILAVARLFERYGVEGLEERMRELMENFRKERPDIVGEDKTVLVLKALVHLANIKDVSDVSDVSDIISGEVAVSASQVVDTLRQLTGDEESEDRDERGKTHWPTARSVGRILRRLRLRQDRESNRSRNRLWTTSKHDVIALARAYGITV